MSAKDQPPTTPPQALHLLSVTSAAELLDCSRGHIYGLIAAGELAAVDIRARGTRPKTRVLATEIADLVDRRARRAAAPTLRWPDVLPKPRPDLYPHRRAAPSPDQASYGTTEAAERVLVRLDTVTDAITLGDLHATRSTAKSPYRIEHSCLLAWAGGSLCEHRQERGEALEVRRS